MRVGGCTVKYCFLTKRVLGSMLIIFLSFSAFFEVFFYSIISVGLIYSLAVNFSAGILISDKSLPNFNVMDFFNPVYTMQ